MDTQTQAFKKVFVTGGAGYVGSRLVPRLLEEGYAVRVLDLFLFGEKVLPPHPRLETVKADLRDRKALEAALTGCDAVIHLACISNDPSFELNPDLGRSINYDAFGPLVDIAKDKGVRRFVYASSSSVYGVKEGVQVTEDLPLEPLTDYSKYKAMCEEVLEKKRAPGFTAVTLRPATVCGYSPRLRLDLTVNILTNHAYTNRKILVHGGGQMRPNIHIDDMADLYCMTLRLPPGKLDGKVFNAGYENHTVGELARMVKEKVGPDVEITVTPTNDNRSYHISSEKIRRELGFVPKRTIGDAVDGLLAAFKAGKAPNSMTDIAYYNIKTMQAKEMR